MKDVCLVVPTIRERCLRDFVDRWDAVGLFGHVDLLVVEDNPTRTFDLAERWKKMPPDGGQLIHTDWGDIEAALGESSWIVPRRSDTVRSFGYWWAWDRVGPTGERYKFIATLDDDCYPCGDEDGLTYDGSGFVAEHVKCLTGRTRWQSTLSTAVPRGIPYKNRGGTGRVVINHGLWTNVLDYDAPHQLANPAPERFAFDNRVVPAGFYFPMCGMNVAWKREATVLMYHMLMGKAKKLEFEGTTGALLSKLPFDRFGDIWCGIVAKKICDARGRAMSTGMPYVRHERASDPFVNLVKEAPGITVNEHLWEHVDALDDAELRPPLRLPEAYARMGRHVAAFDSFPEHAGYFRLLGDAMQKWATLFSSEDGA